MSVTYTAEQALAIGARGKTIVSASAGSGKTFVMIEKLVGLILDEANVTDILAVTFTTKAASQMKEKLKTALIKKIGDKSISDEQRKTLKEKLVMLPQADVSTIHSFCSKIIRRYFYLVDVSSDFRILADEAEVKSLQNKALDLLFEQAYADEDEDFYTLLSVYRKKRSERTLRELILSFYEKIRPTRNYRETLLSARYDETSFSETERGLYELYAASFSRRKQKLELLKEECLDYPVAERFLEDVLSWCNEVLSGNLFSMREGCFLSLPAKPRRSKKISDAEMEIVDRAGELKSAMSEFAKEIRKFGTREEELETYLASGKIANALASCVLRFDELYAQEKRAKGALDYGDLEHFALRLLEKQEVVAELKGKYKYVFVDEYQDVNPVQEAILSAVSGKEVFLVGDMKQSIYGFRGANSSYFAKKIDEFAREGNALLLRNNFRSADGILKFVNDIFEVCMTDETGVDYKSTSHMIGGGGYGEHEGRVLLHILPPEEREEIVKNGVYSVEKEVLRLQRAQEKALSPLAKKLVQIVETEHARQYYDLDERRFVPVGYGDICILIRSNSEDTTEAVKALFERGIPVGSSGKIDLCAFSEVKTLLEWLSFLDNTEQDVALVGAMLSSAGGFSEDDLAKIRIRFPESSFRVAVRKYAAVNHELALRIRAFLSYADELRAYSRTASAGEVLTKLIADHKMETEYLAYPNGKMKIRHIERLISEAKGDVHSFLTTVRANGNKISYVEPVGEDAVQVMTVHGSKGLEFPVVIVLDADKKFHAPDADEVLCFGGIPAPRCYDMEQRTKSDTILRKLCRFTQKTETVKDEMNLFYVALTRAKYALHVVMKEKRAFSPDFVAEAKCWADFFDVERFSVDEELPELLPFDVPLVSLDGVEGDEEPILRVMDYVYPYEAATNEPVKSSASVLLEGDEEYYALPSLFGESDREKGTAYHAFLERVDFSKPLAEEYERVKALMTREDAQQLDYEKLESILAMPVFRSLKGYTLKREQQFLVALESPSGEQALYQGAIDLLAIGQDVRIIDYKFTGKADEDVLRHYTPQLELYRRAVSKIMRIPMEKISMTIVNILACHQLDL
ncbi:MAG: UvrD-helicase domain-containing protein [Clostridia bacterium]|nr:UvrD-helicase domain-containing protein [Clostridia bacterium]